MVIQMNLSEIENCPNCESGMKTEGLTISITYRIYECSSCDEFFCESCSDSLFRNDDLLACPHCSALYYDDDRAIKSHEIPQNVAAITSFASYST